MRILFFTLFIGILSQAAEFKTRSVVLSDADVGQKLRLYQKISTLQSHFNQVKKLKDLGVEIKSEGEISIERPNKVIWKVTKPAPTQLIMDGDAVTMESGSGAEKKQMKLNLKDKQLDPAVSRSLLDMVAWLRIDIPSIQKSYAISEINANAFLCDPKDSEHALFKRLGFFLHPKGHLEKLVIDEKSGDAIEIQFSNPKIKMNQ